MSNLLVLDFEENKWKVLVGSEGVRKGYKVFGHLNALQLKQLLERFDCSTNIFSKELENIEKATKEIETSLNSILNSKFEELSEFLRNEGLDQNCYKYMDDTIDLELNGNRIKVLLDTNDNENEIIRQFFFAEACKIGNKEELFQFLIDPKIDVNYSPGGKEHVCTNHIFQQHFFGLIME